MSDAEKVDIPQERQREILALEAKLKSNHFEVLGLRPGATPEEARNAFHALSRKFHPDRFHGRQLGPFKARIDAVFRRLVEANDVLTNPEKRQQYLDENPFVRAAIRAAGQSVTSGSAGGPSATPKTSEEISRDAERRARLARHPYLAKVSKVHEQLARAKAHIAKDEYSHAFSLLNLAAQIDPQNAKVKVLLAEVRRKAEVLRSETDYKRALEAFEQGNREGGIEALRSAVNTSGSNHEAAFKLATVLASQQASVKEITVFAQRAVDAAPLNPEYRVFLARTLDQAGMKALAKKHFDEAARLSPNHPEVKKYAKKRWPF
jgi:curved DNA-binding protein CbpA